MTVRPLLALLLLLSVAARADDQPTAEAVARSEEQLAARWATLREAVEAELGAPFDPPPRFVPSTRADIEALVRAENAVVLGRHDGLPADPAAREAALAKQAATLARACPAKVHAAAGHVLVAGETFRALAELAPELAGMNRRSFLDLVLIHESVHVWQQRRHDLMAFMGQPEDQEVLSGRMSVLEGHAQHVTRRVARRLGLTEELDLLVRANTQVPSTVRDPEVRAMAEVVTSVAAVPYVEGERFVTAVLEALGRDEGLARLFAAPPRKLALLRRPADYLAPPARDVDLREVLGQLQEHLPEGWPTQVVSVPADALRGVMQRAGEEGLRWLEQGFVEAVVAVARDPAVPTRQLTLSVFRCASPEAAAHLVDLEIVMARAHDRELEEGDTGMTVNRADYGDAELDGLVGRYADRALGTPQGVIVVRALVVARGEHVVELQVVHHASMDKSALQALVRRALDLLPAPPSR